MWRIRYKIAKRIGSQMGLNHVSKYWFSNTRWRSFGWYWANDDGSESVTSRWLIPIFGWSKLRRERRMVRPTS